MELSEIKDSGKYLSFHYYEVYYKPIVASSYPPVMLAIDAAINAVVEKLDKDEENREMDNFSFIIEWHKEEIGEVWELQIVAEDNWEYSETFNVQVVRDRNDYIASITQ